MDLVVFLLFLVLFVVGGTFVSSWYANGSIKKAYRDLFKDGSFFEDIEAEKQKRLQNEVTLDRFVDSVKGRASKNNFDEE